MNPFKSVGAKLSLALAGVVALALVLVYLVVVPSLRQTLVDAKLSRSSRRSAEGRGDRAPDARASLVGLPRDGLGARRTHASSSTIFSPRPASTGHAELGGPYRGLERRGLARCRERPDRAARRGHARPGVGHGHARRRPSTPRSRGPCRHPCSRPAASSCSVPLSTARWPTSTRCSAACSKPACSRWRSRSPSGTALAYLFARRIRRLEAAAERIAAGRFDEPVIDRSADELGQLARAFDRMRLRLSQLERARREFIGNASHELRTPLFSLRGFLELLTDEELDEATRREFLETMREQVDRLQRLAEDLLDLTRLDAGRMHLERYPIDLREVAQDLCDEFRAVAMATRARARPGRRRSAERSATTSASSASAGRCSRTRSSTRRPAPACPSARAAARSPSSTKARESRPSTRTMSSTASTAWTGTHASGSGLGLAIARELAEAMGGTLELESADGRTAFTLRLPAASAAELFPRENATVG